MAATDEQITKALRSLEHDIPGWEIDPELRKPIEVAIDTALKDLTPGNLTAVKVALAKSPASRSKIYYLEDPARLGEPQLRSLWLETSRDVSPEVWAEFAMPLTEDEILERLDDVLLALRHEVGDWQLDPVDRANIMGAIYKAEDRNPGNVKALKVQLARSSRARAEIKEHLEMRDLRESWKTRRHAQGRLHPQVWKWLWLEEPE